jgi:error-prone DNA polymerase
MGFYAPAQIVRDARQHGVPVRPACLNASDWDCTLEPLPIDAVRRSEEAPEPAGGTQALRLGLRMVKGLEEKHAARLLEGRAAGRYGSVAELYRRTRLPVAALERLAEADCFASLGLDRRQALWEVRALAPLDLPLFAGAERFAEPATALVPLRQGREVVEDYRSIGLTLRRHPVSFLRAELTAQGIVRAAELAGTRDGRRLAVAGIVLVRQRPGSAKGVMFITIEDETGHANLIVWPAVFARQRSLVLSAAMVVCHGKLQREGEVIHVIVEQLVDCSNLLRGIGARDESFPHRTGRGDEAKHGGAPDPRGIKVATRDFR